MIADSWSTIGKYHLSQGGISQDYTKIKNLQNGSLLAIVSDGCSGANADTDIGSRIATQAFFSWFEQKEFLNNHFVDHFQFITPNTHDYFATLGALWKENHLMKAVFWGDGAILLQKKDLSIDVIQIEFENNTPFYPIYIKNQDIMNQLSQFQPTIQYFHLNENKNFHLFSEKKVLPEQLPQGIFFEFPEEDLQHIFITTDGLFQIQNIEPSQFVFDIFQFKTSTENFLKRKMIYLQKQYQKNNISWLDDFSIAGFSMKETL
jgi:hypothetical protein